MKSRPWVTERPSTVKNEAPETVAIILVRDDGRCTVAWAEVWHSYDMMPGTWPSVREAMRSVERVVAASVTWRQTERRMWEGRLAAEGQRPD